MYLGPVRCRHLKILKGKVLKAILVKGTLHVKYDLTIEFNVT